MSVSKQIARFLTGRRRASGVRPSPIDMRALRRPLPELGGFNRQAICDVLCSMSLDEQEPSATAHYAREDCERFIRTVDLVPEGEGLALEIGANPYFITLLLRWFRPALKVSCTNFFLESHGVATQSVRVLAPSGQEEHHRFDYHNVNVEASSPQGFPFPDESFDGVLFCEVIEHLQMDPLRALREIWRVLRPGGWLILTTPNVARLVNVVRLVEGNNLYDPYSGHGPYGRHNREYSISELRAIGAYTGFELDDLYTSDVFGEEVEELRISDGLAALLHPRVHELGQYIFTRWHKGPTEPRPGKPSWLYMSYGPDEMVDMR